MILIHTVGSQPIICTVCKLIKTNTGLLIKNIYLGSHRNKLSVSLIRRLVQVEFFTTKLKETKKVQ